MSAVIVDETSGANAYGPQSTSPENYLIMEHSGTNETQQETLLPSQIHRAPSLKEKRLTPPPLKTDSVEMENIMVPNAGVMYDSTLEVVRLNLISEEGPPPYNETQAVSPNSD